MSHLVSRPLRLFAASLMVLALGAAPTLAHAADAPDPAAVQAAMEMMSKTGIEHEVLKQDVGEWDVAASMWMMPDAPAVVSKAHARFSEMLDGKWIREDYQGDFAGKPFVGFSLEGFDTAQKKYVSVWVDNSSTLMTTMSGESTDGGKSITYSSVMPFCPVTGGPIAQRWVIARESTDRMTFQLFNTPEGGAEVKAMELVYTRAKPTKTK